MDSKELSGRGQAVRGREMEAPGGGHNQAAEAKQGGIGKDLAGYGHYAKPMEAPVHDIHGMYSIGGSILDVSRQGNKENATAEDHPDKGTDKADH
jgi:hypothetical protein